MNYQKAIQILEIDDHKHESVDISTVKKHYRILVLKYHPDKNREESSVDKFREIHSAYLFLKNTFYNGCNNGESEKETDTLFSLLRQFIRNDKENRLHILYSFLQYKNIGGHIESQIIGILEKLDTTLLQNIHDILSVNLTVQQPWVLCKITEIIKKRKKGNQRIILNPGLMDLFDCNLYKLTVKDQTFIVPLWHHEIVYELSESSSGNDELIIECHPNLIEGIRIDENNNVHIKKTVKIDEIWGNSEYEFSIESKKLLIDIRKLKFTGSQIVILYGQGIPRICKHAIYDCDKKSDIVVNLNIVL